MFNYESMSREQLLTHVKAYAESIHTLSGRAMKQEHEIKRLRADGERVRAIDQFREFLHGGTI